VKVWLKDWWQDQAVNAAKDSECLVRPNKRWQNAMLVIPARSLSYRSSTSGEITPEISDDTSTVGPAANPF
jgi:hypothetical protein